jgi:hypothetical protein
MTTHAQLEEEDPVDDGVEAKGGSHREGEGRALQHYSIGDLDEARMEGEGEDQCTCTHNL